MKSLLPLLLLGVFTGTLSAQIFLREAEYFWDVDPGTGNGTPITATDLAFGETVEALLASGVTTPATPGPHTFNVRVRDGAKNWGPVFTTVVQVQAKDPLGKFKVVNAEYFWDVDPGEGNGTSFPVTDSSFEESVESLLASIPAPTGLGRHVFNARVRDGSGVWGELFKTVVYVQEANTAGNLRTAQITRAEYFWDVDPGENNGTPFTASDGAMDEIVESLIANGIPTPTSPGPHSLNARVRDGDNVWGPLFTTIVEVVPPLDPGDLPNAKLVQAEYFWDADPGQGNGTPMVAADGTFDEVVERITNMIGAPGTPGTHSLSIRARDANGDWGEPFTTVVDVAAPSVVPSIGLTRAEYFWDTDPGQGNGTPIVVTDGAFDEVVESLSNSGIAPPPTFGPHTFNVRTCDSDGIWSPVFTMIVYHSVDPADLMGDPDGDQLYNLYEYFFGTRPLIPDNDPLVWGIDEQPSLGSGEFLFLRANRNYVAPDVAAEAKISPNMTDWFGIDEGAVTLWLASPNVLQWYTTSPVDSLERLFTRLVLRYEPLP